MQKFNFSFKVLSIVLYTKTSFRNFPEILLDIGNTFFTFKGHSIEKSEK